MEEKIIIQSKISNIKLVRNVIWIIGVIAGVLGSIWYAESRRFSYEHTWYWYSDPEYYEIDEYLGEMFSQYGILCFVGALAFFTILGWVFYCATRKITLTVTDKRVYGTTAFGKRVDLPLDMISAVGTGMFKSIAVTTSSGTIKFSFMENRDAIHAEISKLLVNRQDKPVTTTTIKQEPSQSDADELKKYKELLDMGVITQEEFDAKKKQLLGL